MKNSKSKFSKRRSEKIGRSFSIMFNRASMYKMDHPYTIQSVHEVYKNLADGLNSLSPIALFLNRDQFFIDEEPFDQRLNTSRMVAHFKKAGIQSISFEKGVKEDELDNFIKVLVDPRNHPTALSMKNALAAKRVSKVKINHVIYKKVTADDEIVSKEKLKQISTDTQNNSSAQMYGEVLNMMAESILMEEVEKSISLENLLANPEKFSKDLIDKDLSLAQNSQTGSGSPGFLINDQLARIKDEINKVAEDKDNVSLSDLADAVFELKKQLIEGIESQKTLGIIYENEKQIIDEANELTDQVMIQLVKDEYKNGEISIQRLAQIIRRLVPETDELKRILPKLSEAMLIAGMPKADFLQLLDVLAKELQNENLAQFLQKGAENIGMASEDLISEFKIDPSGAAELIYLASEIRKGTGDVNVLKDLLVDYIERIGSKIVLDDLDPHEQEESSHLREVISKVESEIVDRLQKKGIDEDVLQAVQERLAERMEMCFHKFKSEWERRQEDSSAAEDMGKTTIFRVLEESVDEGEELHKILKQVRASIKERGIDENNFQQIYEEIQRLRQDQQKNKKKKTLPEGILNFKNTLLFIEKEISRSLRYETPFSVITFSIESISPQQPIPRGAINGNEINNFIMGELVGILRHSDLVGILTKNIIIVLLPMTEKNNAKVAMSRILKALHAESFIIKGIPLTVKFAGVVTCFDHDQTPDSASFIRTAENEHSEFLIRLRNIHDLY